MNRGDLVRCWSIDRFHQIGLLLEHDTLLKQVKVYFHQDGKIKTLYSRDVEVFRRSPENLKKIRERVMKKLDNES